MASIMIRNTRRWFTALFAWHIVVNTSMECFDFQLAVGDRLTLTNDQGRVLVVIARTRLFGCRLELPMRDTRPQRFPMRRYGPS